MVQKRGKHWSRREMSAIFSGKHISKYLFIQLFAGATRARKSVIRMLVIVVVLFLVCWLPFHVMTLYQNFKPESALQIVFFQVFMFSLWLMFSNSCCNPIVYAVFNRNYRREFGRLLRWAFLQLFFLAKMILSWPSQFFSIFIIISYILSGLIFTTEIWFTSTAFFYMC